MLCVFHVKDNLCKMREGEREKNKRMRVRACLCVCMCVRVICVRERKCKCGRCERYCVFKGCILVAELL